VQIQRYNPDLKKRALANREQRQQDFDNFVTKLKEYSKSDRPIWEVAAEDEARTRAAALANESTVEEEAKRLREEVKREAMGR